MNGWRWEQAANTWAGLSKHSTDTFRTVILSLCMAWAKTLRCMVGLVVEVATAEGNGDDIARLLAGTRPRRLAKRRRCSERAPLAECRLAAARELAAGAWSRVDFAIRHDRI